MSTISTPIRDTGETLSGSGVATLDPELQWVVPFDDVVAPAVRRLGGKGARLARLHALGLPVPGGFCIPAECLEAFAACNRLDLPNTLQRADPGELARIRDALRTAEFPEEAVRAIEAGFFGLGGAPVAVRSSAADEDGATCAFAGQHDTYLQVDSVSKVLERVRDCWASLLSPQALAYRRQAGRSLAGARMGVVVQSMVQASLDTAAGVGFGCDPLDPASGLMMIEACYGLGEGLVSGRLSSDAYAVDADTLKLQHSRLTYKAQAMLWDPGCASVQPLSLAPAVAEASALASDQIEAVALLIRECSSAFGEVQDIEWAFDPAGRLWLLQSRDITTVPGDVGQASPHQGAPDAALAERILWSRMDIGEIFTGRMTPLGVSFARYYQYHVHRDCGRGIGLKQLGQVDEYMGYFRGHVYLNVAYTAHLLSQTPAGADQAPFLCRFTSEEVDLTGYRNPYGQLGEGLASRVAGASYWVYRSCRELAAARGRAAAMVASRHAEYERAGGIDLAHMSASELRAELGRALDYFRRMHIGYLPFYINAFGLYGLLEQLCIGWLPERGVHLQNRLKGDMSNLRTVQSARDLWTLTCALGRYPGLGQRVAQLPAREVKAALEADEQGRCFLGREYADFMRENGVRGREEMELTHPRWVDDPTYVFQMVQTYLKQGFGADERLAANARQRGIDAYRLTASLPRARRWILERVIRLYCGCSRMREETRMAMITSIWLVRRVVVELTRRGVAESYLRSEEEMAWLDFESIRQCLDGEGDLAVLFDRDRIDAARRLYRGWERAGDPPLTFIGTAPRQRPAQPDADVDRGSSLKGLGTSRGTIRARARVIQMLDRQADQFQPGEVIVTAFTDASWTPLLALAGGVVTDVGSMLSHSSIVAREFGIPSVVNTGVATRRIRTGDELIVDGEAGTVVIATSP